MTVFESASTARVSRTDLARNRAVWLLTGGTYAFFAVVVSIMPFVLTSFERTPLLVLGGVLAVVAALHLLNEPPPIGTRGNHLVLVSLWAAPWFAAIMIRPDSGELALAAAMFVAPLTSMRLTDRRQIAAHLGAASAVLVAIAVTGLIPREVAIAAITTIPSMWVLAVCVVVVLEAAERQGEELERLVRRDPLTGVGNRRLLTENLGEELQRHARMDKPLTVLTLDLNGFKELNDTHGHAAGDEVLLAVSEVLAHVAGPRDTVARPGGDEFCIVLTETSAAEAQRAANAVRAGLAQIDAGGSPLTTGIGMATFPVDAVHPGVLLHVADERLLESKGHGGDADAGAERRGAGLSVWRTAS